MTKILVTGSTGQLGRPTTNALRGAGEDVRELTRSGSDGSVAADLVAGTGLGEAFAGVDTVVHLATSNSKRDLGMATNLMAAAEHAGVSHLVLVSIVGIEHIPLGFYRDRLGVEEIARASSIPLTIQRATQFHSLFDMIFSIQKFSPVIIAPRWRFQPIAVEEVGKKLAELAVAGPQGRVDDIGGPEQHTMKELHAAWKSATGSRRPLWDLHLPGKLFAAYDSGVNLVPGKPYGEQTFESYLQAKYR